MNNPFGTPFPVILENPWLLVACQPLSFKLPVLRRA